MIIECIRMSRLALPGHTTGPGPHHGMTKKISAALLTLSILAAASPAFADPAQGYACTVGLEPASFSTPNGFGTQGTLVLTLYSQPNCGGTQTAYVYLFSVGATAPNTNTLFLYSSSDLQSIFQAIMTAKNKASQGIIQLATNGTQGYAINFQ
jgi:hypothetical protein